MVRHPSESFRMFGDSAKIPAGMVSISLTAFDQISDDEMTDILGRHFKGDWGFVSLSMRSFNESGVSLRNLPTIFRSFYFTDVAGLVRVDSLVSELGTRTFVCLVDDPDDLQPI